MARFCADTVLTSVLNDDSVAGGEFVVQRRVVVAVLSVREQLDALANGTGVTIHREEVSGVEVVFETCAFRLNERTRTRHVLEVAVRRHATQVTEDELGVFSARHPDMDLIGFTGTAESWSEDNTGQVRVIRAWGGQIRSGHDVSADQTWAYDWVFVFRAEEVGSPS